MKPVGFAAAALVIAAVPFEAVSFGVALFGATAALVVGARLRKAVKRFDASIAELKDRPRADGV